MVRPEGGRVEKAGDDREAYHGDVERPCQYIAVDTGERCSRQPARALRLGFSWEVPNPSDPERVITFYASHLCDEHKAFADAHRKR